MFEAVKSLCAAVTNNMKNMMETVGQSNANPVNPTLRITNRDEIKEMEERQRKGSLR